jgi:hypothetical protein
MLAKLLYKTKDPRSLSFMTYLEFNFLQVSTIAYGFVVHDKLLALTTIASLLTNSTLVMMMFYYKINPATEAPAYQTQQKNDRLLPK